MNRTLDIHNDVTAAQLAVRSGDLVSVLRDDGRREMRTVWHEPTRLGDGGAACAS